MSKLFIEDSTLSAIGEAIRSKAGTTDLIAPGDMPGMILNLETEATPVEVNYPDAEMIHEGDNYHNQTMYIQVDTTNFNTFEFYYYFHAGIYSNYKNSRLTIAAVKGMKHSGNFTEQAIGGTSFYSEQVDETTEIQTICSSLSTATTWPVKVTIDATNYTSMYLRVRLHGSSDSGTNRGAVSITEIKTYNS